MKYLFFLFILFHYHLNAQEGTYSSTLLDETNMPLPGATIVIKGTTTGTSTDFDGNYSINCTVGDILIVSYVGYADQEILITEELLGITSALDSFIPKKPVEQIKNKAYKSALQKSQQNLNFIPSISTSKHTFKNSNNNFHRIKAIQVDNSKVQLTYFKPDIFLEAGVNNTSIYRFIKKSNLFQTQSTFTQGRPINNNLTWQGPETNEIFSFGPSIGSLSFNSNNPSIYDNNGSLEANNTKPTKPYSNQVFSTSLTNKIHNYFKIFNQHKLYQLDLNYNTNKDVFNQEQNNYLGADFNFRTKDKKVNWNVTASYTKAKDYINNVNGLQNKIVFSNYITPVSFQNNQGTTLPSGQQRSFSSSNYNNPLWLLEKNNNYHTANNFRTSLENDLDLWDDSSLKTIIGFTHNNNKQSFWLPQQTIGFSNQKNTQKTIKNQLFYLNSELKCRDIIDSNQFKLDFSSSFSLNRESLHYNFNNFSTQEVITHSNNKTTTNFSNQFELEYDYHNSLVIQNHTFYSSVQEDKWLQPSINLKLSSKSLFYSYGRFFREATLNLKYYKSYSDTPIYYSNKSHNSLLLTSSEFQDYTENNDLFIHKNLSLESKEAFEIGAGIELLRNSLVLGFNYFSENHNNSIFPIVNGNSFQLENVANSSNKGFEARIEGHTHLYKKLSYKGAISFSKNKTKVTQLYQNRTIVPIAGFSTTSNNLIEGQPAGVIVGSAYLRDNSNNIVIGPDGFPLVDPNPKIIGDPTPEFTIGFTNSLKLKNWTLDFTIDAQKGGDVWNGSQNVLNYHGVSQESAYLRNVSNYVFNGVLTNGSANTTPVSFASPNNSVHENRRVRYGFEGIAEEAITDGSYLNLKSISLSYKTYNFSKKQFLKELKFSLFAENLFTLSKFNGAAPYSSLFDNNSANGLNLFNNPLVSTIGLQVNVKI